MRPTINTIGGIMSEIIKVIDRIGTSPSERGSQTAETCPDLLSLAGGLVGVIGEVPDIAPEHASDQGLLVVPENLVFDALQHMSQS